MKASVTERAIIKRKLNQGVEEGRVIPEATKRNAIEALAHP